jgi:hypothetical protein
MSFDLSRTLELAAAALDGGEEPIVSMISARLDTVIPEG